MSVPKMRNSTRFPIGALVLLLCFVKSTFISCVQKNGINSYSIVLPRKPAAVSASFVSTSPTAVDGSAINTTAPMLSPS